MEKSHPQAQIIVEKCRPSFVKQISIVNGFLPKKARVKSAFIEFCCESCQAVFSELVEDQDERVKKMFADPAKNHPFTAKCTDCAAAVNLDTNPLKTFSFFKR
jgi:endogenous inhibitor of DNA gyrase (YacG/DUF329 family)